MYRGHGTPWVDVLGVRTQRPTLGEGPGLGGGEVWDRGTTVRAGDDDVYPVPLLHLSETSGGNPWRTSGGGTPGGITPVRLSGLSTPRHASPSLSGVLPRLGPRPCANVYLVPPVRTPHLDPGTKSPGPTLDPRHG